tara:strand:+ start:114 stop:482 length:369 start_codon:yes stop_codon:yes gene_type:complete
MKAKIKSILLKTIKEYNKDLNKGNDSFTAFIDGDYIKSEWDIGMDSGPIKEEWFFVPDKEHQGNWCFMCDGGMGWEMMNCDSDYNYKSKNPWKFSELCSENFEKAGLFVEPYASWRYDVYKN